MEKISIVGGCGHVGLPLGIVLSQAGYFVTLYDINLDAVKLVNAGKLPFLENDAEEILKEQIKIKRIIATSTISDIADSSIIISTIGTPVDEFQSPVPRIFIDFLESINAGLRHGQLFILRSTVFPGTSRWIAEQLEPYGVDLAFCPERIVQGDAINEIYKLPQIVSGANQIAVDRASALFKKIGIQIIECLLEEAELAKLYLNAFRYSQFAISNEFYRIAVEKGLDYSKILNVMTKDYDRGNIIPKAGLSAGPCLLKDTQQLIAYSSNSFQIGSAAVLANEGLPFVLIRQIENLVDLKSTSVGLLGMAFKAKSDDIRSSLSYKIKKILQVKAKQVFTSDPYVSIDPNLLDLYDVIKKSDLLVVCVPHPEYNNLDFKGKIVINIWNTNSNNKDSHYG
jgi:UDP-N-acetyl-D-mannosaminuronic acid dehydrogenase